MMDCKTIETREGCYTSAPSATPKTIFIRTQYGVNAAQNPIIVAVRYTDSAGEIIPAANASNVKPGACCCTVEPDVVQVIQPLLAGNNVISTPTGTAVYEVEVRNHANGNIITAAVVAQTATSFTVNVAVAVAQARILWDR
jgi:hypothetical protein